MEAERLAHTIPTCCRISGLGRTSIYEAIKSGALVARKCGRRTLILARDLEDFLNRLPTAAQPLSDPRANGAAD